MAKAKAKSKVKFKSDPGLITIRLDKDLLDSIKLIAKIRGMGYKTLLRQVLSSYIKSEKQYGDGRVRDQL